MESLILEANFNYLEHLDSFLRRATPLKGMALTQVVLAVHELCANIVQHAYAGIPGLIRLEAVCEDDRLYVRIEDQAPNHYQPKPIEAPEIASLPESGWGMYIVYRVMDTVEYERLAGGNEWRLHKRLHTGAIE